MDQRELVRRAQAGDHDAFAALARGALARLLGTARLILRDNDRASDAVQEALFEAWRDIRALRDPDRLDAWLHRILVRSCYSIARRDRRRDVAEVPMEPYHDRVSGDGARAIADRDEMERAFRRLTQDERTILTLVYFADMTVVDASVVLGVPLGTAKSRLHHALRSLRSVLDADQRAVPMFDRQPA